jgi:hypothetical protein
MKKLLARTATAVGLIGFGALAWAQTYPVPQVQFIGPNDLFQDIVGGFGQSQSYYAPASMLGNYSSSLAGNNPENALIGGDATTNLFQRGTTGSSVTTAVTYGGPDRWAYWSGTSTAITVSRDNTTGDVPTDYQYAFKLQRTSGQTGVVQACMAQEVESASSYAFEGQTAEFDAHVIAGSGFTGTNVTAYIVYGTGSNEGTVNLAFGLNGGGGGSSGWTGQANAVSGALPVTAGVSGRYTVAGVIPSTATEVAVAICYTPVGTAGASDYVTFSGLQLTRNSALTSTAGASGAVLAVGDTRAKAFSRRLVGQEVELQERYFQSISEPATGISVGAMGVLTSTTSCALTDPLAVTMRAVPTISFTGTALSTATWRIQDSTTSTLASTFLVAGAGQTTGALTLTATLTTASTAGWACQLQGVGGGSIINASAEL